MLNLIFISIDIDAYEVLRQVSKDWAVTRMRNFDGCLQAVRKYDAVIVDCRTSSNFDSHFLKQSLGCYQFSLALINTSTKARYSTFECGFRDYIGWPLVNKELKTRLLLQSDLANSISPAFASSSLIDRCCNYMLDKLETDLRLPDLCRSIGTNPTTLTKIFKAEFNTTPIAWLKEKRLTKAYQILSNPYIRLTVLEVAHKSGYQDSNNFSTAFKARFGQSPIQFRKFNKSKIQGDLSKAERGKPH